MHIHIYIYIYIYIHDQACINRQLDYHVSRNIYAAAPAVLLCYIMLYYIALYYSMLYYTILYYINHYI